MNTATNTENLNLDIKTKQESILLDLIKELCNDTKSGLSTKLLEKVNRIIAESELTHYASLHKLNTSDESTSTLLGVIHQTSFELSFDEQSELNQAIIQKIQNKLPIFTTKLEELKESCNSKISRKDQIKELQKSLENKLDTIESQEIEKVELMMEWINHRLNDVSKFSESSSELFTLKTRILDLKSKILHLQILQNIFTETNQSIKAYGEIQQDLTESLKETEKRIKNFKDIVESDYK